MCTASCCPSTADGSRAELEDETMLHPDRLFPADPNVRAIARRLYETVRDLPIVSPHGHTDPAWYALNEPFPDPAKLFVVPDHYIFRMLHSQGVRLEDLGIGRRDGAPVETGGFSPRITICSGRRRRGSGSTTPSRRCSGSRTGSPPPMPIISTT
jgi:hypothetical protein